MPVIHLNKISKMKIFDIDPGWFFTEVTFPLRFLQIYVRGDAIVLIPFTVLLLIIGLFSIKWMFLLFGIFLIFRFFGEMIYWFLQQFGDRKYRPNDFGFKKLDNNAIYILYQLSSLVLLVMSTGLVIFILLS
jgi:hypothetical protein